MFSDRNNVRPRDFHNLNVFLHCTIEVDMIRTDTCGNTKFEIVRLHRDVKWVLSLE